MTTSKDTIAPAVIQAKDGGYFVRSASRPGAWWLVDADGTGKLSCSCPATTERCRHMRLAAEFWSEQDRQHARPHIPAAPASVFVD